MKKDLGQLLKEVDYTGVVGSNAIQINQIVYDSRCVLEGSLFVCIKGAYVDARQYLLEAIRSGAKAIILEESDRQWWVDVIQPSECLTAVTWIFVPEARLALAQVSAAFWGHPARDFCLIGLVSQHQSYYNISFWATWLMRLGYRVGWLFENCIYVNHEPYFQGRNHLSPPEIQAAAERFRLSDVDVVLLPVTPMDFKLFRVAALPFSLLIDVDGCSTGTGLFHDSLFFDPDIQIYVLNEHRLIHWQTKQMISQATDLKPSCIFSLPFKILQFVFVKARKEQLLTIPIPDERALDIFIVSDALSDHLTQVYPDRFNAFVSSQRLIDELVYFYYDHQWQTPNGALLVLDEAWQAEDVVRTIQAYRSFCSGKLRVLYGASGNRNRQHRRYVGQCCHQMADQAFFTLTHGRGEPPQQILADLTSDCCDSSHTFERRDEALAAFIGSARPSDILILLGKGMDNYEMNRAKVRVHSDISWLDSHLERASYAGISVGSLD